MTQLKPLNAYNHVPDGANIYDKNNNYIGVMNGYRLRHSNSSWEYSNKVKY